MDIYNNNNNNNTTDTSLPGGKSAPKRKKTPKFCPDFHCLYTSAK